ncbi:hypothetical protein [Neisseria cinerea]|uniref:hypothetical protein n=1 Tax=Neisseria cinerea TaxID=483 RepID=UPI001E517C88|nr:hypothetical protein [Neisseria cinerea]
MTDRPNLLWIKPGQAEIMEYCEPDGGAAAVYRDFGSTQYCFSASGVSIGLTGACRFHGFGQRLSLIAAACGAACPDLLHSGVLSAIIPSFVLPLPESSDV